MSRKLPPRFEVKIYKLAFTGEGVGDFKNRSVFVFGALPGETVLVRPLKKGRRKVKAELVEVLKPVAWRRGRMDAHYLASSPWQIIPEEKQLKFKKDLAIEVFKQEAGRAPLRQPEIAGSRANWHYRNKMEYSFTEVAGGALVAESEAAGGTSDVTMDVEVAGGTPDVTMDVEVAGGTPAPSAVLSLALHKRGRWGQFYALKTCAIAHARISQCAGEIIKILRKKKIKLNQLKNLVLRYSYKEDKCLAALYVADKEFPRLSVEIKNLVGWIIIYSDPLSPATITTDILHKEGRDYLYEEVLGVNLTYFYNSFFQVNPPTFSELLKYLKGYVKAGGSLVDLYCGVGTIGLALSGSFDKVVGVEFDKQSVIAAGENVKANKLTNATILAGAVEKQDMSALLTAAGTLVVDPPRSGLHPKLIKRILEIPPKQLIYISCNAQSQARDYALLKKKYKTRHWRLFDLYPQTPHVESVLILERRRFNLFPRKWESIWSLLSCKHD